MNFAVIDYEIPDSMNEFKKSVDRANLVSLTEKYNNLLFVITQFY